VPDLVEFLTARLEEDAQRWKVIWRFKAGDKSVDGWWDLGGTFGYLVDDCTNTTRGGREVAAKRKRVALYVEAKEILTEVLKSAPPEETPATGHSYVRERIKVRQATGRFIAYETSVRLDAMVYADHSDFDPSWRVE
jgi:hypothetical protein